MRTTRQTLPFCFVLVAALLCSVTHAVVSQEQFWFEREVGVVAAYYLWYGSMAVDGDWVHWNHEGVCAWVSHHQHNTTSYAQF